MARKFKIIYVVRSEHMRDTFYVFGSRPVLSEGMTELTGKKWVLETLHYHFTKLKETEFSKDGWNIRYYNIGINAMFEDFVYFIENSEGEFELICMDTMSVWAHIMDSFDNPDIDRKKMLAAHKRTGKYVCEDVIVYRRELTKMNV